MNEFVEDPLQRLMVTIYYETGAIDVVVESVDTMDYSQTLAKL